MSVWSSSVSDFWRYFLPAQVDFLLFSSSFLLDFCLKLSVDFGEQAQVWTEKQFEVHSITTATFEFCSALLDRQATNTRIFRHTLKPAWRTVALPLFVQSQCHQLIFSFHLPLLVECSMGCGSSCQEVWAPRICDMEGRVKGLMPSNFCPSSTHGRAPRRRIVEGQDGIAR